MERVSTPPVSTPGLWFAVCNVSPPRSMPGSQAELNISAAGKHIGADPELPDAGGCSEPDRTVRPFLSGLSGIKASRTRRQKYAPWWPILRTETLNSIFEARSEDTRSKEREKRVFSLPFTRLP